MISISAFLQWNWGYCSPLYLHFKVVPVLFFWKARCRRFTDDVGLYLNGSIWIGEEEGRFGKMIDR